MLEETTEPSKSLSEVDSDSAIVLWLDREKANKLLSGAGTLKTSQRIILSTLHYGADSNSIPPEIADTLVFVHTSEMPKSTNKLLMRSTGWFRTKRIYNPEKKEIQANAYFALKVVGDAIKHIRGYFYRDYFIEKIEHMIDDLPYTIHLSKDKYGARSAFLCPGDTTSQKLTGKGGIRNITEWIAP